MNTDNTLNILNSLQKMKTEWHRIMGFEGNYYLGNEKGDLLIAFLTYKRVCDICKDQYRQAVESENIDFELYSECYGNGYCKYDYRERWSWEYVISQENITYSLEEAVDGINFSNYMNIGYGDSLIPRFYLSHESVELYDQLLLSWAKILNDAKLGTEKLSEEDWLALSKLLRKHTARL